MRVDVIGYLAVEVSECPLLTDLNSTRTARPVMMMIPCNVGVRFLS
jgi:hypothetical protein